MFFDVNEKVDWYIVFGYSQGHHWWRRILKDGFEHCWAIRWDGSSWLVYHPAFGTADVYTLNDLDYHAQTDLPEIVQHTEYTAILYVKIQRDRGRLRVPWIFAPSTCVEAVKYLLGIRALWTNTPYQLYKYLRKHYG
jgi:hypothetical protein